MLELSGKDFKVAIIKVLQQAIINSLEINELTGYLSKEIKVIKKWKILELENIITEIKNLFYGLNSTVEMTGDRTNEHENRSIEFIQCERERNGLKKMNKVSGTCGTITKGLTSILKVPAGKERAELKMYSKK